MKNSSSTKQQIPHEVLEELMERNSYDSMKNRILQPALKPWKPSAGTGKPAIAFTVKFSAEAKQQEYIRILTREHHVLTDTLEGNLDVVMSADNSRVECNGKSIHGENFIYINGKKNGFVFCDKVSKTYLQMPDDSKAGLAFAEKLTGKAEPIKERKTGKSQRLWAEIMITAPFSLKYELELDTDDKWAPFRHDVTCMLIGCADRMKSAGLDLKAIIETGVPVKGEVFMETDPQHWEKMSSFAVSDLRLYESKDNPFAIPDGYRNLRDVDQRDKRTGRRTYFEPPVRLSDYRTSVGSKTAPGGSTGSNYPGSKGCCGDTNTTEYMTMSTNVAAMESVGLRFPSCLPETYGALLANLVDEKMLDDIKYIANMISKRLTGFSGSNGNIPITWMDQFKAHADALASGDPGGGLYDLLHDEEPTGVSHPQKLGMLDKLAISSLSKRLASGDNLSTLSLSATLQAAVNNVIADGSIAPSDRFSSLPVDQQGLLVDAYVFKGIGTIKLSYPSSAGPFSIFYDLLNVKLDDIDFDIKINNTEVFTTFNFDSDSIHLVINLPDASGKAWVSRWVTGRYLAITAITVIACFLFPFTCFLMDMAILVGIFIGLDLAFVSIDLANLAVDSHIRLVPNASNVLQPDVQLSLDADVSASYISVVPTGIHQILSLIYTIILNATDLVINTLETQLHDKLNDYLKNDLKITYPPDFGPVPLVGISNNVEFAANDHGYVEQALNAGLMGVINPYITQIDSNVRPNIMILRDQYKAQFTDPVDAFNASGGLLGWVSADLTDVARYYLGTALSQNFINDYIYVLWRQFLFNYNFTPDETNKLFKLLKLAFPNLSKLTDNQVQARLWPAVPPRTLFTPKPASEGSYYATTFFDDVRICFSFRQDDKKNPDTMEFAFAGQVSTELGFGGLNEVTGKLDLLKLNDRVFDIYFDLKTVGVHIIHPEVQYFAYPDIKPSVTFDYSPLDLLQDMLRMGLAYSLAKRSNAFIPRNPGDPMYIQRYPLGNDALQVIFSLVPFRGNLYVGKGLSGKATAALQGAADIDTMNKITADIIRALI